MATLERRYFNEIDAFRGAPDENGKWYLPRQYPVTVSVDGEGLVGGGPVIGALAPDSPERLAKFEVARGKYYEFCNAFRDAIGEPLLNGDEYLWGEEIIAAEQRAREARAAARGSASRQQGAE
jgi:hypothetical protein